MQYIIEANNNNNQSINSPKKIVRHAKTISNPKDIEYLANISAEDAARKSTIMNLFADFGDGPKYYPYDIITIPKGKYGKDKKNTNSFTTTVGLWIFNKGCIEDMSDVLGYINEPITADKYEDINLTISYAKLEDKITIRQLKDFIMQSQIYMSCTSALAPSHTMRMLLITTEIEKKKKQLANGKYKEAIANNDIVAVGQMEKELLDFAKDYMGEDISMDMYNSGARSSWGNNFKNMYVMKGAVQRSDGSFDVVTSSYISGLNKDEFVKTNDSSTAGPMGRAVYTQNGGYMEKQFVAAFQHVVALGPGTDCGTKRTVEVYITKKSIKDFMYCFVVEGSKLVEITSENKDKFIGRKVKIRFASMCEAKNGICEKCLGTLFSRLGMKNIGIASFQSMSRMKNVSMKQFHDSTIKFTEFDVNYAFNLK